MNSFTTLYVPPSFEQHKKYDDVFYNISIGLEGYGAKRAITVLF